MDNRRVFCTAVRRRVCRGRYGAARPGGCTRSGWTTRYPLSTAWGMSNYYLIVYDFINYAQKPGASQWGRDAAPAREALRPTASASRISTPSSYNLLFRTLPEPGARLACRTLTSISVTSGVSEVIDYVIRKYGADHVAQIVTFGTMAARAVIRDVGRVLDMPYQQVDAVAKLVPHGAENDAAPRRCPPPGSLPAQLRCRTLPVHELIDMALKLEGMPRHASTPCGGRGHHPRSGR